MNDYIVRATAGKSGCDSSAGKTPYRWSDDGKHDEE